MTTEEMNHKMLLQTLENQLCLLENTLAELTKPWRINYVQAEVIKTKHLLSEILRS